MLAKKRKKTLKGKKKESQKEKEKSEDLNTKKVVHCPGG